MLIVFPLISFIILFLIFWTRNECWRSSLLLAALGWSLISTVLTEILSGFNLLTLNGIGGLWIGTIIASLTYFQINFGRERRNKLAGGKISLALIGLLGGIVFIFAAVGLIAAIAPPNNWDSMTYHLSRVVHWIQNQSLAHYPTYYPPQLFHPPGAGIAILHFQILSGGDRFANLVQWFSAIGSAIGVSLIAQQLGADRRGQVFAAVFCTTIPMGILQASSTQNDYVVCFWVVCFVYYILRELSADIYQSQPWKIGATLGIALFTKTTAYIFCLPFLIWWIISGIKRWRVKVWQPLLIIIVVAIALNLGHYWRNWELFGSPIGAPPQYAEHYQVKVFTIATFLSNVIRNLALHVGTKFSFWNGLMMGGVNVFHRLLGIDTNDPRITWLVEDKFYIPGLSFNENNAGNPIHFMLILVAIAIFLRQKSFRKQPQLTIYVTAIVTAFLIICLMLKLQPWHSRHHLTLFVLFAPFIGIILENLSHRKIGYYLAGSLILLSLPWVFKNQFRPIIGAENIFNTSRNDLYFTNRPRLIQPYNQAVDLIKSQNVQNIGLSFWSDNAWEYPFWVLLGQQIKPAPRIENVTARNNITSIKLQIPPYSTFEPDAIIYFEPKNHSKEQNSPNLAIKNQTYAPVWSLPPVSVLLKKPRDSQP
jgi:hypothetical protein